MRWPSPGTEEDGGKGEVMKGYVLNASMQRFERELMVVKSFLRL
jgi:hypothetical protein